MSKWNDRHERRDQCESWSSRFTLTRDSTWKLKKPVTGACGLIGIWDRGLISEWSVLSTWVCTGYWTGPDERSEFPTSLFTTLNKYSLEWRDRCSSFCLILRSDFNDTLTKTRVLDLLHSRSFVCFCKLPYYSSWVSTMLATASIAFFHHQFWKC